MKHVEKVIDRLVKREPVLFFGFLGLIIGASFDVEPDTKWGAVIAAGVLLFQRAYSTSKVAAEEKAETAAYVGAVEHQALAQAGRVLAGKRS